MYPILGPRPYDQLPAYLADFDLGLIPFIKDEFTRRIYPMKINEYLAAGLPVVSTPFADLSEFNRLIRIADDPEGFREALYIEIAEDSPAKQTRRIAQARRNSWEGRAEAFSQFLEGINASVLEKGPYL
ncbi:MAG: glycosyltransferase family 1 protein [Bacteroidia bacterium]|nr:glycosyltransferase family 1 protein [Bacteroidia bacterium]